METLFPEMIEVLTDASSTIVNLTGSSQSRLSMDEYTDAAETLIVRLKEFCSIVKIDYSFSEGLAGDITNCSRIINENRAAISEQVDVLLNRNLLFGGISYDKTNTRFLDDVISSITAESHKINKLMQPLESC